MGAKRKRRSFTPEYNAEVGRRLRRSSTFFGEWLTCSATGAVACLSGFECSARRASPALELPVFSGQREVPARFSVSWERFCPSRLDCMTRRISRRWRSPWAGSEFFERQGVEPWARCSCRRTGERNAPRNRSGRLRLRHGFARRVRWRRSASRESEHQGGE